MLRIKLSALCIQKNIKTHFEFKSPLEHPSNLHYNSQSMAILVSAHELTHSFAGRTLFENLTCSIQDGERIGLIGPNGAGKTTLLKILAGKISAEGGTVSYQRSVRIGFLEQIPQFQPDRTVRSTVQEGIPHPDHWEEMARVEEYLSKLSLDGSHQVSPEDAVERLSGGWKKRVALARELVKQPDLLLLDEPTNHLDVESIVWLEEFLRNAPFALLTITHDRLFLQKVSNRILELDRRNPTGLLSVNGSYADYLERKEHLLGTQQQREKVLKNTLRQETEWLKRGPKARGTKQQARIDRALDLQQEVNTLSDKNKTPTVAMHFQSAESQPKKLIQAKKITKSHQGKLLFSELDLLIVSGARIGLLGANGCGKSTLIRVLLGMESPDQGSIQRSDLLEVAFFEQNRETLDPEQTVIQAVCPEGDHVNYQGSFIHVRGYLDRFLFSPEQMKMKVRQLSGGEQSRLLIARLMLKPANLLVLDEPTNDLDLATLNILQDCLTEFKGAILLVTHDRYFLDQVATQIVSFPFSSNANTGKLTSFADLFQWEEWFKQQQKESRKLGESPKKRENPPSASLNSKKKKLSFNEQYEFEGMEEKIHAAEQELQRLADESAHPDNISNALRLTELHAKMGSLKQTIDQLYARWAELEAKM